MENEGLSRRGFLGTTATVATAAGLGSFAAPMAKASVVGANDRIRVGFIGPGGRGFHLLKIINEIEGVEIVAVADIYEGWKNRGIEEAKKKTSGDVAGYDHHLKLLDDPNVDVVVCATPEHAHKRHIVDTINSDRDIYCEKPMCHSWDEGLAVIEANKRAKKIIQIGTQRRSVDNYYKAREIIQSGELGEITACRGWWHRNSKDDQPQWRYWIPEDANENNINWKEFERDAKAKHEFNLNRYFQWRCYWDYSNGPAGDLMVHQLDAINIMMQAEMPLSAQGLGGIYRFEEGGRTTPDTWHTMFEFPALPWAPKGYLVSYSCVFSNEQAGNGEMIMGTNGTIITSEGRLQVFPERADVCAKPAKEFTFQSEMWGDRAHLENFFDCCRTRKEPNCTEYNGHYASSAASLACISHFTGKRVNWDADRERPM